MKLKLLAAALAASAVLAGAQQVQAGAFTTLNSNYTATVVAVSSNGFLGGIAFAPNGNLVGDSCVFSGGQLQSWSTTSTTTVHGNTIFTDLGLTGNGLGCSLVTGTGPGGGQFLYTNTSGGVVRLDNLGNVLQAYGGNGNALGLSQNPLTGLITNAGAAVGTLFNTNPLTGVITPTTGNGGFTDQITWDNTGTFLYTSNRTLDSIDVFDNTGNLVHRFLLGHEPDGIALTGNSVCSNNVDATLTCVDLTTGIVTEIGSGGFRGDNSVVGADGCWYVAQDGTRFDDGTVQGTDSIVKICALSGPGFTGGGGGQPPSSGVPEPMSLALFGAGLVGFGLLRRRLS